MSSVAPEPPVPSTAPDWDALFKQTELFAANQVDRLRWRGATRGLLPNGYDPNSIAAEAFLELFQNPLPNNLTTRWAPHTEVYQPATLLKHLRHRVRMLINRLHHRMETSLLRNEADLAPVQLHDAEIVPFWETVPSPDPTPFEHAVQSENLALETFKRDFDAFLGKDRQLKKVFAFHCDGIFKPKALAAKLKLKHRVILKLRKRLRSRLTQFLKGAESPEKIQISSKKVSIQLIDI